jgi:hypothetical protein
MTYKCEFLFSYSDMESTHRLMLGETEIDLIDAATLLNAKDKRITELEDRLIAHHDDYGDCPKCGANMNWGLLAPNCALQCSRTKQQGE